MIITFPTGLYKTILPKGEEAGNVTYNISSGPPPTTPVRAIQFPSAEKLRPLPPSTFSPEQRRIGYGELVFTVAKANRSNPGSGVKQFEVGEVLEFEDDTTINTPVLAESAGGLEIQHNTNVLDLSGTGLTQEEIDQVVLESERRQRELEKVFTRVESEFKDLNTSICENQKQINETNKAIRAVRVAFGIPETEQNPTNEILIKLIDRLDELRSQREIIILSQNVKFAELETTRQDLLRVSQMVR